MQSCSIRSCVWRIFWGYSDDPSDRLLFTQSTSSIILSLWCAMQVQVWASICPTCWMYLSNLPNGFVQIRKCICLNDKIPVIISSSARAPLQSFSALWTILPRCHANMSMSKYLFKSLNVFVQIIKCICLNLKKYICPKHQSTSSISSSEVWSMKYEVWSMKYEGSGVHQVRLEKNTQTLANNIKCFWVLWV